MENVTESVSTIAPAAPLFSGMILAIFGAVISAALAGIGSAIGISFAGTKSAGVLSEKPHLFGKLLVLCALPGSQGVYGLLIAILTLAKIKFFEGGMDVPLEAGFAMFWAGVLMGFSGLVSAIFQGKVAAAGVGTTARQESMSGKAIVLAVLIETYAIFGLLIALLVVNSLKL